MSGVGCGVECGEGVGGLSRWSAAMVSVLVGEVGGGGDVVWGVCLGSGEGVWVVCVRRCFLGGRNERIGVTVVWEVLFDGGVSVEES